MHRTFAIVGLLCAAGCIERQAAADDPQPGAFDAGGDATSIGDARVVDAQPPPDLGPPDLGPLPDVGPRPEAPLARALSCDLANGEALRAVVRWVACAEDDESSTVAGLMEGWAAGLFGTGDPFARQLSSQQTGLGCDRWQCLSTAGSCADARQCRSAPPAGPEPGPDVECEPGRLYCEGNAVMACDDGLPRRVLDCTPLEMTCQHAPATARTFCAGRECQTALGVNDLRCEDNQLIACDGELVADCDAWRPGTRCQSFAIGGEVPINFCGPEGFGGAGAYAVPVECADDGAITFTALQVDEYRFDCRRAGYSGCDTRGCVE